MKKKRIFAVIIALVLAFVLAGCYVGEVGVETTFNYHGGGERVYILDVMDDTLYDQPIPNPDDPDGTKEFGAIINSPHFPADKHPDYAAGGVAIIHQWLVDHAPNFITVHDPIIEETYHRVFKLSFTFENFDEFLVKYGQLVNLSPTIKWDDYADEEKPSFKVVGGKTVFYESREMFAASIDWALQGIYADIYSDDSLGTTPADIWKINRYHVVMGSDNLLKESYYDAEYVRPQDGKIGDTMFVDDLEFTLEHEYTQAEKDETDKPVDPVDPGDPGDPVDPGDPGDPVDPGDPGDPVDEEPKGLSKGAIAGIIVGSVVVVGGIGVGVWFFLKKRP